MVSVSSSTQQNRGNKFRNAAIGTAAVVVGWEGEVGLRKISGKPLQKFLRKKFNNIKKYNYKPYLETTLEQNNLAGKLKILDLNEKTKDDIQRQLKINLESKIPKRKKFISHILRKQQGHFKNSFETTLQGKNAFFLPRANAVVCNMEKFSAPLFHEIQHKLNSTSKNFLVRSLYKIRNPLVSYGTILVQAVAIFTDKKENPEAKSTFCQKIKENCGLLAMLTMLPQAAEECIANISGIKLAKKAGVKGDMLNVIKKTNKLSIINYVSSMLIIGFCSWAGNKIRDYICDFKQKPQNS